MDTILYSILESNIESHDTNILAKESVAPERLKSPDQRNCSSQNL